ncbi:hypothetical protein ABIB25_004206 [Nakamurella sp. UYEF19]|uniref:hypothetical protein n=1 Tax=Nakamurella sp. UYEF19 TaxID=1756392 RepID=UPI003391243D
MFRRFGLIALAGAMLAMASTALPAEAAQPAGSPIGSTVVGSSNKPVVGSSSEPVVGSSSEPVAGSSNKPVVGSSSEPVVGGSGRPVRVPPSQTAADVRGHAAIPFSRLRAAGQGPGTSTPAESTAPPSGAFVPLPSRRVLDTRSGVGVVRAPVGARRAITLDVARLAGIPVSGAAAVLLNVTATAATGPGFVTVYPSGLSRPIASNLNYVAGATVANLVVAELGNDGKVLLYNGSETPVQLFADLVGYYNPSTDGSSFGAVIGGFLPVGPLRVLDTRIGDGAPQAAIGPRGTLPLRVLGRYGIPTTDISAVAVNLTVTGATQPGYVSAYPNGLAAPATSSLTFAAHRTVATLAIVRVGADGRIRLRNGSAGNISLIVDVTGYIRTGVANAAGSYTPLTPSRVLDTRIGLGAPRAAVVGPRVLTLPVAGRAGVPSIGVSAVALTLTVTNPVGSGYLTAFAGRAVRPLASNLNYTAGRTVSNMVVVPVGSDGRIQLFNGSPTGSVQLVADVAGYFLTGARTALTWSPTTLLQPVHGNPLAISCATNSFCMAGDAFGSVLRFDGRVWSEPAAVDPDHSFVAMSCTSTTFCVGGDVDGRVVTYDGRTWTEPQAVDPVGLAGLSCVSNSFCMAVGLSGQIVRFDGRTWRGSDVDAEGQLTAVACVSVTFCQAVDLSGRAFRWNGTRWSSPILTDPDQPSGSFGVGMWAVSCATTTWCVAVEDTGRAVVYDGSWRAPAIVGQGAPMYQVSCTAARFCAATDVDGGLLTTTGGAWTRSAVTLVGAGAGSPVVSCVSPTFCVSVDTDGNGSRWNGTDWSSPSRVELNNLPTSISCPTSTFCQAVDGAGRVFSYGGVQWSGPTTIDQGGGLTSVSCPAVNFCAAVDLAGRAFLFDGRRWSMPTSALGSAGTSDTMVSVSCSSRKFCAAVTAQGRAVTYDGVTWSGHPLTLGSINGLTSVSCAGTVCIAVGSDGYAYRFAGAVRSPGVAIQGGPLLAISCAGTGFCAAVGLSDDVLTFDGSRWSPPRTIDDFSQGLVGVSCTSAIFCTAVDLRGRALNFDGAAWSPPEAIAGAGSITSLSCASSAFCAVIDASGHVALGRV